MIGAASIFIWSFLTSFIVIYIIKAVISLRPSDEIEESGLDIVEIGVEAYPEFK